VVCVKTQRHWSLLQRRLLWVFFLWKLLLHHHHPTLFLLPAPSSFSMAAAAAASLVVKPLPTRWLAEQLAPALSPVNSLRHQYSQLLPRAREEVAALEKLLRDTEQDTELLAGIDCFLECILGPLVLNLSVWNGAMSPTNLNTLYLLLGDVLRVICDVFTHQRERLHTLLLAERSGWIRSLVEFAAWCLDTDTHATVYRFVRQGRATLYRCIGKIFWDGLLQWPCAPKQNRATFIRLAPASTAHTLLRCYLAHQALVPYPTVPWFDLLNAWVEHDDDDDDANTDLLLLFLAHLATTCSSTREHLLLSRFEATSILVLRTAATRTPLFLTPEVSCKLLVTLTPILHAMHKHVRQARREHMAESVAQYALTCYLEQTLRITFDLWTNCQAVTSLDEMQQTALSHACCDLLDAFCPRWLIKPEIDENYGETSHDDDDEAPLARCIVHCLLQLPLPPDQSARILGTVRAYLEQTASEKVPALLRMAHHLAGCDGGERAQAHADALADASSDPSALQSYNAYLQAEEAEHAADTAIALAALNAKEKIVRMYENDEEDGPADQSDDDGDAAYEYEGVSGSETDATSDDNEDDDEDVMDIIKAADVYEDSTREPTREELDLLRKRLRRVPAASQLGDGDEEGTSRARKKARRQAPDENDNDDDVLIVRLVLSAITCIDDDTIVFNADHKAGLRIATSQLVPGQQGLFACGAMTKESTITWYTGQIYVSTGTTADRRQQACVAAAANAAAANSTTAAAASSADYFFEVKSEEDDGIRYIIDGFVPDARFGGAQRCLGTYLNHSDTRCNTFFRVRKVRNQRGILVYRVAIMALRDIAAGEELLIDYGPAFAAKLRASGCLCE
jgi:hypothetical protein